MVRVISADEAAAVVKDGATVAISGGGYRVTPETLVDALARRFEADGAPRGIAAIAIAMIERARGGKGGAGSGLNRIAIPGLMRRVVTSSFSRSAGNALNVAIRDNTVAAYNVPMGSLVQLLRATAAGRPGYATPVGIGTYVDPRLGGGRSNAAAAEDLCRIERLAGEEVIWYPRLPVDVAFVKASAADARGNLYFDRDAFDHGTIELALAAHQSGGIVIAEVNRLVEVGTIHPRMGRIPGRLVSAVVVQPEVYEDEQAPILIGARDPLAPPATRNLPRDLIARIAVDRLAPGVMVNLGAGIPMYEVPEAARLMGRDDLYFTVEQGPMGGWPAAGGVSRHVEIILDQNEVFQFYEGGGPDISILSFGEVDRFGNVNVSRLGSMLPGCGGFINITHGVRDLVFCGTLTTGGLEETICADGLSIEQEGRIRRFVPDVEEMTFDARRALSGGQRVTVVTDRGVFAATPDGLVLTAVVPGVDVARDILAVAGFPVSVAPDLTTVPARLLVPQAEPARATVSA